MATDSLVGSKRDSNQEKSISTLDKACLRDRVVQRLIEAEKALTHALSIDQLKLTVDAAAAQQVFASRQKLGEDVVGYAHTIKIRALSRLGELLKELDKAKGTRGQVLVKAGPGRGKKHKTGGTVVVPPVSCTPTLSDLGISKKVSAVAQQLANLPEAEREAIANREKSLSAARREQIARSATKHVSLPDSKYRVVYADPPWKYADKADAGGDPANWNKQSSVQAPGGVGVHYPSMSIKELCDLPVTSICEDNAVLFLWVTSPLLFDCAPVIKSWGFKYKASFVWDKVKHNMGHYNSVRHELLLVCTRGSCQPDERKLFDSVQVIERGRHSEKPETFRDIINTLYPHGKRVELFARIKVDGWDGYGYEVPSRVVAS